jgi:hypothetical protein
MTLGVAFAGRQVALSLIERRRSQYVTFDELVVDAGTGGSSLSPEAYGQVKDEIMRVKAVLDADGRALERISIAANDSSAASAAALLEALVEAGVCNVSSVEISSDSLFADTNWENSQPSQRTAAGAHARPSEGLDRASRRMRSNTSASMPDVVTMARTAAVETMAGADVGGGKPWHRPVLAAVAGAVALAIGVVGWSQLKAQPRQDNSPSVPPLSGPTSVTLSPAATPIASSPATTQASPTPDASTIADVPTRAPIEASIDSVTPAVAPPPTPAAPGNVDARPAPGPAVEPTQPAESPSTTASQDAAPPPLPTTTTPVPSPPVQPADAPSQQSATPAPPSPSAANAANPGASGGPN